MCRNLELRVFKVFSGRAICDVRCDGRVQIQIGQTPIGFFPASSAPCLAPSGACAT